MSTRKLSDQALPAELPRAIGRPANAALVAHGITTLDRVAAMTERELLAVHGVGPKAIAILKDELEQQGRTLAE